VLHSLVTYGQFNLVVIPICQSWHSFDKLLRILKTLHMVPYQYKPHLKSFASPITKHSYQWPMIASISERLDGGR